MHFLIKLILFVFIVLQSVNAEIVSLQVREGINATASYAVGDTEKNPVLILHGFLQTHNFSTISRLHENLEDSDFPVLSPTLSLGITKREKMLGCEALHLHSLKDEANELKKWVEWLYKKHNKPVILIAHSAGGKAITRYLDMYPDEPVSETILLSFSHLKHDIHVHNWIEGQEKTGNKLGIYSLGFCDKYQTREKDYHSYVDWGADEMIGALKKARHPVSVILGTEDDRIQPEWKTTLVKADIDIISIKGANHFFDSTHEFDLFDAVEALLGD